MEQGKLAGRELTVQKKVTALVSRLCVEFGVTPPALQPFKPKYMTRSRNLLRNEAVANALESIVNAIAPAPILAPVADPDSGNATPEDAPLASTAPEALDPATLDDELDPIADDIDAALGGVDFIPDGGEDDDQIVEANKMVSPKPVKAKGRRR